MKLCDCNEMVKDKIYFLSGMFLVRTDHGVYSSSCLGGEWSPVTMNEYTKMLWEIELIDIGEWLH